MLFITFIAAHRLGIFETCGQVFMDVNSMYHVLLDLAVTVPNVRMCVSIRRLCGLYFRIRNNEGCC